MEELFHAGIAAIEHWEAVLWYGSGDTYNLMYQDVRQRFETLFAAFYGDAEGATVQVLRQEGRTLFLNSELLVRLEYMISDVPFENIAAPPPRRTHD